LQAINECWAATAASLFPDYVSSIPIAWKFYYALPLLVATALQLGEDILCCTLYSRYVSEDDQSFGDDGTSNSSSNISTIGIVGLRLLGANTGWAGGGNSTHSGGNAATVTTTARDMGDLSPAYARHDAFEVNGLFSSRVDILLVGACTLMCAIELLTLTLSAIGSSFFVPCHELMQMPDIGSLLIILTRLGIADPILFYDNTGKVRRCSKCNKWPRSIQ
jgi:hypothetical protein